MEESSYSIQSQVVLPLKSIQAIELKPSTYLFEQSRMQDSSIFNQFEE